MSLVSRSGSKSKNQQIIDRDIHPVLDKTYINLNHINIMVIILLYIFGLKIVGDNILGLELLNLKDEIIKLKKKTNTLINDYDELKMIVELSQFMLSDYVALYNYIDERWIEMNKNKTLNTKKISPSTSQPPPITKDKVENILNEMIRIFIYDRTLLTPFIHHQERKLEHLKAYKYTTESDSDKYITFDKFKDSFIGKFWSLFENLKKLIDYLNLDIIFNIKYSFLYEFTTIAIESMFKSGTYSQNFKFIDIISRNTTTTRTPANISMSYQNYYNIVKREIIDKIDGINDKLKYKINECENSLSNITTNNISSIRNDVNELAVAIDKIFELSNDINDMFNDHVKQLYGLPVRTEDEIKDSNKLNNDFNKQINSIKELDTKINSINV
jgi:hypothetical protein